MRTLFIFIGALLWPSLNVWAQEDIPDVNAVIFVEEEPTPINMNEVRKQVSYPKIARDKGLQGSVVARVLVSPEGEYIKHEIITGADSILVAAVEPHLSKLTFTPGIQGGKPIYFWVNIPFNFKILNSSDDPWGRDRRNESVERKQNPAPLEGKQKFKAVRRIGTVVVLLIGLGLMLEEYTSGN